MEKVQPIRDQKQIDAIKKILKGQSARDYLLFTLGINSGLRISDLLELKINQIWNGSAPLDHIEIREKKTKKPKYFKLGENPKKAIKEYIAQLVEYDMHDPVFCSKKSDKGAAKPISRQQAYNIINNAADLIDITERIGTHTLRKTFGYHAYKKGYDLAYIQKLFNHSSQAITLEYIGITQDNLDDITVSLNL